MLARTAVRAMGGRPRPADRQVEAGGAGWPCELAQGHPGHYGQLLRRDPAGLLSPRPARARGYGVDVPAMSFQLHEWDIHALCPGTGGAVVTEEYLMRLEPLRVPAGRADHPGPDDEQRRGYLAGWAMVSSTAVEARIRMSFSPGATSTP